MKAREGELKSLAPEPHTWRIEAELLPSELRKEGLRSFHLRFEFEMTYRKKKVQLLGLRFLLFPLKGFHSDKDR